MTPDPSTPTNSSSRSLDDHRAIEKVVADLDAAWATHDADKIVALYSPDGTVLNSNSGVYTSGTADVGQLLAKEHRGPMARVLRHTDIVNVRLVTDTVAFVDLTVQVYPDHLSSGDAITSPTPDTSDR